MPRKTHAYLGPDDDFDEDDDLDEDGELAHFDDFADLYDEGGEG